MKIYKYANNDIFSERENKENSDRSRANLFDVSAVASRRDHYCSDIIICIFEAQIRHR